MSVNQTNLDNAVASWGSDMPTWVRLLAEACDRSNQRRVGDTLGKSSGYVSRILSRKYNGSYAEAEKLTRAAFGAEQVMCPLFGAIALKTCIRSRRRTLPPQNHMHIQFADTCPGCPNNTDTPHEEED